VSITDFGFAVDFDFSAFEREAKALGAIAESQLPFALAKTLTQTAKAAVGDVQGEMKRAFDRPTRYTLNVFGIIPATKQKLQAEILPRSFAGKGNIAWEYLDPEVIGGPRKPKRFEKRLQYKVPGTSFLVPGKAAKLDASGNMSRGQITKILSGIGALGDQSATRQSAKRSKRLLVSHGGINGSERRITNSDYFIAKARKSGKPLAIYQLQSRGRVVPVMIFTRRPAYKKRFNFAPAIERSVRATMPALFTRNLTDAIATAHR